MNIFQFKNESRSKVTNADGKTESLHVSALFFSVGWHQITVIEGQLPLLDI
jgi:hypothetical protein